MKINDGKQSQPPQSGLVQVHRFLSAVSYSGPWWDRRLACHFGQASLPRTLIRGCLSHQWKPRPRGLGLTGKRASRMRDRICESPACSLPRLRVIR